MWLLYPAGAVLAALFLATIRAAGVRLRPAAAVALVLAALVYAGAAAAAGDWSALALELVGVGAFGVMAGAGLRRDPGWLVAGWLAHPLWDAAFHLLGSGGAPGMVGYAHVCLGFDPVVAGYLVVTQRRARSS